MTADIRHVIMSHSPWLMEHTTISAEQQRQIYGIRLSISQGSSLKRGSHHASLSYSRNEHSKHTYACVRMEWYSSKHFCSLMTVMETAGIVARQRGRISSSGRVKNFLFSMTCRLMRYIRLPIQWVPGALSPGVKRPELETDHSSPTNAEVKITLISTSALQWVFMNYPRTCGGGP
jgi:hypothetical protein